MARHRLVPRLLLVLPALALVIWLGLGLRSSSLEQRGAALSPSQAAHDPRALAESLRLLRGSLAHNADSGPLVQEAGLLNFAGRRGPALAVLDQVVRREPDNAAAWTLMASVAGPSDPVARRRAIARLRQLNPAIVRRLPQ